MPRIQKTSVQKILKPSHLQAIGLVAAHWSSLELTTLWVISQAANISLKNSVVLAGPSNMGAWMDMLKKLSPDDKELKEISQIINDDLQKHRNKIVHSCWQDSSPKNWYEYFNNPPTDKALGIGIPKRGKSIFLDVQYSPKEMRTIARRIEAIERSLLLWWSQQRAKSSAKRLADALYTASIPHTDSATQQTPPTPFLGLLGMPTETPKIND